MFHADTGHHTWPPEQGYWWDLQTGTRDDDPCRHWSPHLATRGNIYACPSIGETNCPAEAAAGCHDEGADRLLVSAGKSRTALSVAHILKAF